MAEENQETPQNPQKPRRGVSFPGSQPKAKKSKAPIIILVIVILALIIGGVWFFVFRSASESIVTSNITPSPMVEHPSPTPTAEAVNKDELKIEILNGTGIAGAAGDLRDELEGLGYSDIEVGNASSQDYTAAEITFASSVAGSVQDELVSELEKTYKSVDSSTSSLDEFDIQIITGIPIGYQSPTPEPKATATPTGSSATATPTP
jgi:hypothetical protein